MTKNMQITFVIGGGLAYATCMIRKGWSSPCLGRIVNETTVAAIWIFELWAYYNLYLLDTAKNSAKNRALVGIRRK